MIAVKPWVKWGLLWRSDNRLDGSTRNIMGKAGVPFIFQTRREARAFAEEHYGYIRQRPDLKGEPHGWRMPLPIRISISTAHLTSRKGSGMNIPQERNDDARG